jgi:hypothetical protein
VDRSGIRPLTINFGVNDSDNDGTIAKYEWDVENDG